MRAERRPWGRTERGKVKLPEDPGHPIDRIIRDAMAEGKFDHLEGHGKPLPIEAPGDPRVSAFRLLKNAGFSPEWAEIEGSIERAILDARAGQERYAAQREAALAEIESLLREWPASGAGAPATWVERVGAWLSWGSRAARLGAVGARLASAVDILNASRDRALAGRLRRLHAINRMIDRLNLIQPVRGRERCREDVTGAADEFVRAFPRAILRFAPEPPGAPPRLEWTPGEVPEEWLRPPASDEEPAGGRVRGRLQAEALVEYQRKRRASA